MALNINKQPALLAIPNDRNYLPAIIAFVEQAAIAHGFSTEEVMQINLAVEEVIDNVLRHAYRTEENALFEVGCQPTPIGMEFKIADKGLPYNPALPMPFSTENPELRGLGMFLISRTMDEVKYLTLGIKGKAVMLTKHFSGPKINPEENPQLKEYQPEQANHTHTFDIHPIRANETGELSRLAYSTYGYTYIYEHIYFPERILKLNNERELFSLVATSESGEIAGHVALICYREFPGIAEMAIAMINPAFRGFGLLEKITACLIETAIQENFTALYVQATTAHTRSQSAPLKLGFLPCCLLLAYTSPMDVKEIVDSENKRQSVIVSFRSFEPHNAKNLYVPEHHRKIIHHIYNSLGAEYSFNNQRQDIPELSSTTVSQNPVAKIMRITIDKVGDDIISRLKMMIYHAKQENLQLCELFLNMNNYGVEKHFKAIENLGFLFSGIFPCRTTGDFIVMLYFNGFNVDFDNIHLLKDNGEYLLEYIRNDYTERFLS